MDSGREIRYTIGMSLDKERKKSEHKEESISWLSEEARASIWAVIVLAFSVVFALSLLDAAGTLGMWVKSALEALVGWGAWVVPALLILVVYLVIIGKQAHRRISYMGVDCGIAFTCWVISFAYSVGKQYHNQPP